jgi:hypothetical protein
VTFFQWILVFAGVVFFLWLKMRKSSSGGGMLKERQISLNGTRIITPLTKATPLSCLLDDDRIFGESFKDKVLPELPHEEGCHCVKENYIARSREWFTEQQNSQSWDSDLGPLNRQEARYYKYALIAEKIGDDPKADSYKEGMMTIDLKDEFKQKVSDWIKTL